MYIKKQIGITVGLWAILLLVFALSNPYKWPVIVIILPFVLIFLAILHTWRLVALLWRVQANRGEESRPSERLGLTVTLLLTVLLVLQSLGQLTWQDVLTLVVLFVVGYFYLIRMLKKV